MAPVTFSPNASISSHTLSADSAQPPPMDLYNTPATLLANKLMFLQPTAQLNATFLSAVKHYLDPVAAGVSELQSERQREHRKRKRGDDYDGNIRILHLKKVHLQGFSVHQVFQQMKSILKATAEEIELVLPQEADSLRTQPDVEDERLEQELDEEKLSSQLGEEGIDLEYDGEDLFDGEGTHDEDDSIGMSHDESIEHEGEEEEEEEDEEGEFSSQTSEDELAETYKTDPNGLNDGFFEIDQFNKQTDFLEQRDNHGEAVDSDGDEIDWDADPYAISASRKANDHDEVIVDEDFDDERGPTFGNIDLNMPEGESDDEGLQDGEMDAMDEGTNANNIMYADFFAPPARKTGKKGKKRGRPNPHNFPPEADSQNNKPSEDIQNVISRVHGDLFSDEDNDDSDDSLSDLDLSDPRSRRSTHERRLAKIAEQIRKLEAENVAKRAWQLSGEARGTDRPMNSLLEEDLEYERAGKPVPVITQEVTEDIESLVKRRILAGEFDEVLRRRPNDLATGPKVRRGHFELDDTKNTKSLAELYEEDHLRQVDPNFMDARDEKLKKAHAEIETLWKSVSAKLDSLSSAHFRPKLASANIEIRVDAPAITMEDARPTAAMADADAAATSMLAPQELYKPGDDKTTTNAEIVTKSGMPVARDELSREQKLRRRRREKERIKKAGLHGPTKKEESTKEKKGREQKQLLSDLKKGGVQVIGKGGITDVEGREAKGVTRKGVGTYKL